MNIETELLNSVPLLLIKKFFHVNLVKYHCHYNKLRHRHFRKFDFMLKQRSQQISPHVTYNPNWVINLSNVEIPDLVLKNLSLGNKYNFPYIGNSELPIVDIIKNFESKTFNTPEVNKKELKVLFQSSKYSNRKVNY